MSSWLDYTREVHVRATAIELEGERLHAEAMMTEDMERLHEIAVRLERLAAMAHELREEHSLAVRLRGEDGEAHE